MKLKIRKGDTVEVISGNYKGERGEVQSIVRKKDKKGEYDTNVFVVVAGLNLIKKHQRRTGNVRTQVGIIEREGPLHISNVMLLDTKTDKGTRFKISTGKKNDKVRVATGSGTVLD